MPDLRTLADEWNDELVDLAEGRGPDGLEGPSLGEMADRVGKFELLCDELGIEQSPDALLAYGSNIDPTLIPESEFEDYARQMAEDIGAIPSEGGWPIDCIDWERAAKALRMDYTPIEYDGETYYHRAG